MKVDNCALSVFSFVTTLEYLGILICGRIYGLHRWDSSSYGPNDLSDIPWMIDSVQAIISGLLAYWIVFELHKADKAKGKVTRIPRMKFKNFGSAILFFSTLFFGFISLFAIREYNEKMSQVSYMFRKTFWQYCSAEVPIWEILATSVIFGTILAIGFSKTPESEKKDDGNSNNQIADKEDKKE